LTSSSTTYVSVYIACVDFHAPSGDVNCDRGLVSLGGLGRPFHFILSGDGRKSPVPTTNSSSEGFVFAPLVVASFRLRAVRDTNSSLNSFVGAPFYVA
jgi:hypothetical protein